MINTHDLKKKALDCHGFQPTKIITLYFASKAAPSWYIQLN